VSAAKGFRGPIIRELRVQVPKYPGRVSVWKQKAFAGSNSRSRNFPRMSRTSSSLRLISASDSCDMRSRTETG